MSTFLFRAAVILGACTGLMPGSQPVHAQTPPPGSAMTPKARVCIASKERMEARVVPPRTMTVSNEGGWCTDYRWAGQHLPYNIVTRPAHGEIQQKLIDDWKIISYRPLANYTGPDSFELVTPAGNIHMVYNVTVTP